MDFSLLLSLLFLSSFIRILLVFSILRRGLGFSDLPSAIVVLLLSAALSFGEIPTLSAEGSLAAIPLDSASQRGDTQRDKELAQILLKKTDPAVISELQKLPQQRGGSVSAEERQEPELSLIVGAYALSEVRKAFKMGVTFLIPFVVIDILLAVILSAIGVTAMSVEIISFPAKLLTFLMLDGWSLVVGQVLR